MMRKIGFWIGLNLFLFALMIGLSFWLYHGLRDRQISQFIQQKEERLSALENSEFQSGNIDTTHIILSLPKDEAGQVLTSVQGQMVSYVQERLGQKKPAGKIKRLLFVSSKQAMTNFTNVKARELQAQYYQVKPLAIEEEENPPAGRILLTADNQLFTLGIFLKDLPEAGKIAAVRLKEELVNQGLAEGEIEARLAKFGELDLNGLSFSYGEGQVSLQLPDASYGVESLSLPLSALYPVLNPDYLSEADRPGYEEYQASLLMDKKHLRQIALTFDDGPNPNTTPIVLDLLKKYNAKATFFVVGKAIAGNEAILQRMVAEGHVIANHTWNHPDLVTLSGEQIRKEIQDTQNAIMEVTGIPSTMVRPPYGSVNQAVVDQMCLPSIYWSVDSKDWQSRNPQAIFGEIKSQVCPGSIILMHDIHPTTVESLEPTLQFLTAESYNMVTITELLGPSLNPQYIYYSQESAGPSSQ